MYDWNGNGQIDPTDQFIDYMVFQEVMGRGSNDEGFHIVLTAHVLLNVGRRGRLKRWVYPFYAGTPIFLFRVKV